MKLWMLGIAGLFNPGACGADVIVGDVGSGSHTAGALGTAGHSGAFAASGGGAGGVPIVVGKGGSTTVNSAGAPPASGGAPFSRGGVSGTGATSATGTAGTPGAGTVALPEQIPLTPLDGRISADNALKIQGALFADADPLTRLGMTSNFRGANACIAGTATPVDIGCTPVAPATDCYEMFFGAYIGLNLNQAFSPTTGDRDPQPFDASALKGFYFEVTGNTVPAPSDLRFAVETPTNTEFCNVPSQKIKFGANILLFSDLAFQCWNVAMAPPKPTAETVQSALVRLKWRVVTNSLAPMPFDFCISNIRALRK